MDYRNQRCDGCGLILHEGEDIVVCPACGTPQHRACYEKKGRCVNADRHESGFDWQSTAAPAAENSVVPCPVCRHENAAHAAVCERCGQPFTSDALDGRQAQKQEITTQALVQDLFSDAPADAGEIALTEEERRQVEYVLAQRMLQATPGMSEEQSQERLCGHPLRQVMTFLAVHALAFVNKFRKLENGSAFTWNWAAFFLTPYWFFYRKLYKPGIVVLTARICLAIAVYSPVTRISELMISLSDAMRDGTLTDALYTSAMEQIAGYAPVMMISLGVLLLLAVLSGLLADRLYHRHVQSVLTELKQEESRDAFLVQFLRKSAVSPLAAALSYAAISLVPNLVMSLIIS